MARWHSPSRRPALVLAVAALLGVHACSEPSRAGPPQAGPTPSTSERKQAAPARPPQPSRPSTDYGAPLRSEEELRKAMTSSCQQAARQNRPWLVELSAAWCGDCRALHALKQQSPLAEELARWPTVVVNVGDFDRHRALRERLGVRAIAHWAVLAPERCEAALGSSPVIQQRTLEPRSGAPVTPAGLTEWLHEARDGR